MNDYTDKNVEDSESEESTDTATLRSLESLRLRLLDLTGRNRLINFRHTRKISLRVIDELPNQLVDTLLNEKTMTFKAIPDPKKKELIEAGYIEIDENGQEIELKKFPTAEQWGKHLEFDTRYDVPRSTPEDHSEKHSDEAIQTLLYPSEMEAVLKNLHQTSESAILEMGANILYLAFGFLEWFESRDSEISHIAPLYLVPVRLEKDRLNTESNTYEYNLYYSDEDIISNLSLREKLKIDFGLALPELDETTKPEEYFDRVIDMLNDIDERWSVHNYITLTLLNFSKLLMYLDLDPNRWPEGRSPVDHPVTGGFLSGYQNGETEQGNGIYTGFGEEYEIDKIDEAHDKYKLIADADSSQHSALIDAIDGKNLVIEGPPGTGKSQTITNLISAAIAQGKKVLFVAEKLAALDVVKRRLDDAGLGEFCLELHSHKSQKVHVIADIDRRLNNHKPHPRPRDIKVDIERYEELKKKLNDYANKVNQVWKNTDKTIHEILASATYYRDQVTIDINKIHPSDYDGDVYTSKVHRANTDQVEIYRKVYQAIDEQLEEGENLAEHPWYGVTNAELQIFDVESVIHSLNEWQESLISMNSYIKSIGDEYNVEPHGIADTINAVEKLLGQIKNIPDLVGNENLEALPSLLQGGLENAQTYLKQYNDIQSQYFELSKLIDSQPLQNLSNCESILKASESLSKLFNSDLEIAKLVASLKVIKSIEKQLSQLTKPVDAIVNAIGDEARSYLDLSISGIAEFRSIVHLVSSLKKEYWKDRNDIFDDADIDGQLEILHKDLDEVKILRDSISQIYKIEKIPSKPDLIRLKEILEAGGAFKWFKSSWRGARKELLGHRKTESVEYDSMLSLIDKAASYSCKYEKLVNNITYRDSFGEYFQGIETDIDKLESLRRWYKKVRETYGIGFGSKVFIGDGIIGLPITLSKAIISYHDHGIDEQLQGLLENINTLLTNISPNLENYNNETILYGEDGVITYLNETISNSLSAAEPVINKHINTVGTLYEAANKMTLLSKSVNEWHSSRLDDDVFIEKLVLEVGPNVDNKENYLKLENTLKLAEHINSHVTNRTILNSINSKPSSQTFEKIKKLAASLDQRYRKYIIKYDDYNRMVQLELARWTGLCEPSIDELIKRNQLALGNASSLESWLDYIRGRNQIELIGLGKLADAVEHREIDQSDIAVVYQAAIHDYLAKEILQENTELANFSGISQEAMRTQFKKYDQKLQKLQREEISWAIDQVEIPHGISSSRVKQLTEKSLLLHECSKKTRHIPIRQLLSRAGNALIAAKPCFMMGPMSVAQYLTPGRLEFDLVIMDEASQIKPQDALGAIARGKQVVIVGDPKQLPPTSFFDRVVKDDEEEDKTSLEESESILDATLPIFPCRRLRWHYRSEHESLIAFSNHSFYDSNLVIFPSPNNDSDTYGIQYEKISRGSFVNRKNLEEAKVISEAVRAHFRSTPKETLGVVAMNTEQRDHIEAAIETLAKDDSQFQDHLDEDAKRNESLFIKNLENVQGDERDVIIISMTYGPQEPRGRVFQRFGPINSDVGWRRLNVLFTRSRKRMHVISSMSSEDIVVNPSSKRGVRALRSFLSFCETGVIHKTEYDSERQPDSDFEIAVMDALDKAGFQCVPQVGVAGFFIDVGVLDPGNPGRFLMGIECDGATYHSAKSARDRDSLRQAILERLGWNIRRVWSTDWFKHPEKVLEPIISELNKLKSIPSAPINQSYIENSGSIETNGVTRAESITTGLFDFEDKMSLQEKLIRFNDEVIRKDNREVDESRRILRPSMREAFIEYKPTNKVEFLEMIPAYLRSTTDGSEGKYLEQIFEIINASVEESFQT